MGITLENSPPDRSTLGYFNLAERDISIVEEPFFCFVVDNFFPDDLYQTLYDEFPVREAFTRKLGEGKRFIEPTKIREVINTSPSWEVIIKNLSSQWFMDHLFQFLKPHLFRARGLAGLRRWKCASSTNNQNAIAITERKVKVDYEFSRLPPKAFLSPHTDKLGKLASLLFYFPHPDWLTEYQGGTEFYAPKDPAMRNNWSNRHLNFDAVQPFLSVNFKPNTLIGFVKSANSYHGVPEIKCPNSLERTSFNLNYSIPVAQQRSILGRAIASYHRRLEARYFRTAPDLKMEDSLKRKSEIEVLSEQGLDDKEIARMTGMTLNQLEYFRNLKG